MASRKEIICHHCGNHHVKNNYKKPVLGLDFCGHDCFCKWYKSCSKQDLIDADFAVGRPSLLQGEKWDEFERTVLKERLRSQALADKFGLKKETAAWNRRKVIDQHGIDISKYNQEVNETYPRRPRARKDYIPKMPKEFYLENYNAGFWDFEKNKWSYGCTKSKLSKLCGHSDHLIGKDLHHYGIKKHIEEIPVGAAVKGKKFDLLRPVRLIEIRDRSKYIWECKCDCGKTCVKSDVSLIHREHIKIKNSCGCENKRNARWEKLDISPRHFNRIKMSAKKRKLDFDLTPEFLHELYHKQKKKSAISGRKLVLPSSLGSNGGSGLSQCPSDNRNLIASLDRIDSKKGYIKTNVWWTSRRENICKQDLSIDDMQQFFADGCAYLEESRRIQAEIEAGRFS